MTREIPLKHTKGIALMSTRTERYLPIIPAVLLLAGLVLLCAGCPGVWAADDVPEGVLVTPEAPESAVVASTDGDRVWVGVRAYNVLRDGVAASTRNTMSAIANNPKKSLALAGLTAWAAFGDPVDDIEGWIGSSDEPDEPRNAPMTATATSNRRSASVSNYTGDRLEIRIEDHESGSGVITIKTQAATPEQQ